MEAQVLSLGQRRVAGHGWASKGLRTFWNIRRNSLEFCLVNFALLTCWEARVHDLNKFFFF